MDMDRPISMDIHGYIHGYPRKICGYGYGWQISYPRQAWRFWHLSFDCHVHKFFYYLAKYGLQNYYFIARSTLILQVVSPMFSRVTWALLRLLVSTGHRARIFKFNSKFTRNFEFTCTTELKDSYKHVSLLQSLWKTFKIFIRVIHKLSQTTIDRKNFTVHFCTFNGKIYFKFCYQIVNYKMLYCYLCRKCLKIVCVLYAHILAIISALAAADFKAISLLLLPYIRNAQTWHGQCLLDMLTTKFYLYPVYTIEQTSNRHRASVEQTLSKHWVVSSS